MKIANSCCDGRIVSALEGGYQLGGEFSSAFAQSVKAHVVALAEANRLQKVGFSVDDSLKESAIEHSVSFDTNR
jgi:hypothetical protein